MFDTTTKSQEITSQTTPREASRMPYPSPLTAGAVWRGRQSSGQSTYDVEVRFCSVGDAGNACGTLTIRNLTPSLPKLVTYFDCEIIGDHHSLTTDKWGASEDDDRRHWGRFRRDLGLKGLDSLEYDPQSNEHVTFMRLKERCIIDAGKGHDTSGASFEGFYYIALSLNPADSEAEPSESTRYPASFSFSSADTTSASPARLPSPLPLTRTGSYASVARSAASEATSRSLSSKSDDFVGARVASVQSDTSIESFGPFSPSLEDFPPPTSPLASSCPARPSSRGLSRSRGPHARAMKRSNSESAPRPSTSFYNTETGYRGAWANATMKGFYFASATDPYQELQLRYVGDGLGALLEEHAEEVGGLDEWGEPKHIDERSLLTKEMRRRQRYSMPKGSASFALL